MAMEIASTSIARTARIFRPALSTPRCCRRFGAFPGADLGVFADLKCNPLAVIEMARAGVTVDVVRNGHSQIKHSLIEDVTRFGAVEESAHFYEAFRLRLDNDSAPKTRSTSHCFPPASGPISPIDLRSCSRSKIRRPGNVSGDTSSTPMANVGRPWMRFMIVSVAGSPIDDGDEERHGPGGHPDAPRAAL